MMCLKVNEILFLVQPICHGIVRLGEFKFYLALVHYLLVNLGMVPAYLL